MTQSSATLLLHGYPGLGDYIGAIFKLPFWLLKSAFCRHKKRRVYNEWYEECERCGHLVQVKELPEDMR